MNKKISFIVVTVGILLGTFVFAQTASEITYPVVELGSCSNETECFAYCDLPENGSQCLKFAKKHQLLPEEEIRVAEKVLGITGGPGGCKSKQECENYCDNVANIEVCLAFAEENGLMKDKELEEARKVRAVIQSGKKLPGDCRNKTSCENYCKNPEHADECLAFAEATGFIPPEELEQARKFLPLMKSGQTPGACKSKDECEAYCESGEHVDECISFAEKHGMIREEERQHIEAFKKAGGKGPGGCVGRQCQAFCEVSENQETCFNWAKENGILKEEDTRRMEEGRRQIEKNLADAPPEVKSCIEGAIPGGVSAMQSGKFFGGKAVGEKIRTCFESTFSQFGDTDNSSSKDFPQRPEGIPSAGNREFPGGPGGCQSIDECMSYCKNNPEECRGSRLPNERPLERNVPTPDNFPPSFDSRFEEQRHKLQERYDNSKENYPPKLEEQPHDTREQPQDALKELNSSNNDSSGTRLDDNKFYNTELQKQYGQPYQQQFQEENQPPYEQQYQQQSREYQPPEGFFSQPPSTETYQPPSGDSYTQPPLSPPPLLPETRLPLSPIGLILAPFINILIR